MTDPPRELTSWKEIASYLGVAVRTAQKWERERGLPIRRLPGGRGRVSVEACALDDWKIAPMTEEPGLYYRLPVARDTYVEVRFIGSSVTPGHIELLRQYLALAKAALEK